MSVQGEAKRKSLNGIALNPLLLSLRREVFYNTQMIAVSLLTTDLEIYVVNGASPSLFGDSDEW
jgi:hypothetical protein